MSEIDNAAPAVEAEVAEKPYNLREALQAEYERQTAQTDPVNPDNDEPVETSEPRDDGRDDRGRFASKDKPQEPAAPEKLVDPVKDTNSEPVSSAPPGGWSVASKSAWKDLPEAVRADIAKREKEVNDGFQQYAGMKDLKAYSEAYAREGSSIRQALDGYLEVDRLLYSDPIRAFQAICQGRNLDPVKVGAALAGIQPNGQAQQHPQHDTVLANRIQQLEAQFRDQETARQRSEQANAQSVLEKFASDPKNVYFDNVKVTMGHLIQTGQATELEDAYERAIWMHPEIRPQLIKQQQAEAASANSHAQRQIAADQARKSAKSLTGSPAPGGSSSDRQKPMTIREAAEEAARAQGVQL